MTTYTKVPYQLISCQDLTPADKLVWILIASYKQGLSLNNNQAAAILGISNRSWRYSIEKLLKLKLIERTQHKGRVYRYTVSQCEWQNMPLKVANIAYQSGKICLSEWQNMPLTAKEKENSPLTIPLKEKENINKIINIDYVDNAQAREPSSQIQQLRLRISTDLIKQQQYCKLLSLDVDAYLKLANEVLDEWLATENYRDISWGHLINHIRVKLKNQCQPATRQEKRQQWRQQLAEQAQIAQLRLSENSIKPV